MEESGLANMTDRMALRYSGLAHRVVRLLGMTKSGIGN
jgi:hypothetical protein